MKNGLFASCSAGLSVFGFLRYRDYNLLKPNWWNLLCVSVFDKIFWATPDMSKIVKVRLWVSRPDKLSSGSRLANWEKATLYVNSDGLLHSKTGDFYLNVDYVYEDNLNKNVSIASPKFRIFARSRVNFWLREKNGICWSEIYRFNGTKTLCKSSVSKSEILIWVLERDYRYWSGSLATKSLIKFYTYFSRYSASKEGASMLFQRKYVGNAKYSDTIGKESEYTEFTFLFDQKIYIQFFDAKLNYHKTV